jgi:hypothetical protein
MSLSRLTNRLTDRASRAVADFCYRCYTAWANFRNPPPMYIHRDNPGYLTFVPDLPIREIRVSQATTLIVSTNGALLEIEHRGLSHIHYKEDDVPHSVTLQWPPQL